MNVVFQEEFGQVWTDDLTPYVFTLITQVPPTPKEAGRFFEAQVELSRKLCKKYKEAYLVSDFSKTTDAIRGQLCNYYMEYIPRLIKTKVSYIAFICPQNVFDSLPEEKKAKLSAAPLGIFETFVDALHAVNQRRSGLLVRKSESIL